MSKQQHVSDEGGFWLFGYGSLIWKPIPDLDGKASYGHVRGYVRRFWQASEDHRGTPESPGRVVTLIEHSYWKTLREDVPDAEEQDIVHGAAYHIPSHQAEAVRSYLGVREINGYSIQHTRFYPSAASGDPIQGVVVYIGLPSNPQFLGLQSSMEVARVIARNEGPSGRNDEYLFMLEEGLDALGVGKGADGHVRGLARTVRELSGKGGEEGVTGGSQGVASGGVERPDDGIRRHVGNEELRS